MTATLAKKRKRSFATQSALNALLKGASSGDEFSCEREGGLIVRRTQAGGSYRVYISMKKPDGSGYTKRAVTLGPTTDLTLQEAIQRARDLKANKDELAPSAKAEADTEGPLTLGRAHELFAQAHAPGTDRAHSAGTRGWYEEQLRLYLGPLDSRPLFEVIRDHELLLRTFAAIEQRTSKGTASGAYRALMAIFNFAADGVDDAPRFPTRKIPWAPKGKKGRRDAGYTTEEWPQAIASILSEPNPLRACMLLTYAFTGLRKRAVLDLTWPNCAEDRLFIEDSKGKPFQCPTSPFIWSVIQTARALACERYGERHNYVFPTWGRDGQVKAAVEGRSKFIQPPAAYVAWLSKQGRGLPKDQCPGVFRHSYSDLARQAGLTTVEVAELLNHSVPGAAITEGYRLSDIRRQPVPRRLSANQEQVSRFLLQLAGFAEDTLCSPSWLAESWRAHRRPL